MSFSDVFDPDIWPVFVQAIIDTIRLVAVTLVIGGLLGLVYGTLLYATRKGNLLENRFVFVALNILVNIVRPIPFIIFVSAIAPLTTKVVGTRIGVDAAAFAMTVMALFVIGRVVEQNLVSVDPGVVEAARAMGAGRLRTLATVVVPEGLAPLVLGYTFMFVGIVDMSAIVGAVGGGGLGDFALQYGYQQYNWKLMWVVIVVLIVIVQVAQWFGNSLARRLLHH
ncbi:ABC transporter permease [Tsukamurella sp. 8F]|uniref:methionine ABC transporter permease n=1 Tax=unclassified Tsukamurella TaxID=2633480 RepID=UPI0023B95CD7|nr:MULTISPECIES: methionine ABC transporter permease [unclassified Tsukamurella]MDF0529630.1 ABC transporter permease [Tsukamurella sp. 8J]MDF0585915.1 ABC transporter permease [Tsukamurella sp. 8F]